MDVSTIIEPLPSSTALAKTLDNLLAELTACNPRDVRGNQVGDDVRAVRRVDALNAYLVKLRLSTATGDRNAMFDRLTAGIAACRTSLCEMTNHQNGSFPTTTTGSIP